MYHSTKKAKARPHSEEWQTDTSVQKQWSMATYTNLIKFQVLIMQVIPSALDVIGALSIFLSAVAIIFERQIFKALCSRCCIGRLLDEDEENITHEEEEIE